MPVELLSANHAAALAATLAARANRTARGFVSGVYPITPSTECGEFLCAQEIEKGHVVRVESEHSSMGVCIGASAYGARTFTTSSSNGLAFMAENIVSAALLRLPVVMVAANRAVGPPWNLWADHADTLMHRDAGWVQFYCADNQEVFDTVLAAFRLAEDRRVLAPVMVCQDAFVLSHTVAQTDVPAQEEVDRFLPPLDLPHRLAAEPRILGGISMPHTTEMHKIQLHEALLRAPGVYGEVREAFRRMFGRDLPGPLVGHRDEDADLLVLSMGTLGNTVEQAVDEARTKGLSVGALRVRMFRPLPGEELRERLGNARRVAVLDRDVSPGFGGVLGGEVARHAPPGAMLQNYVVGLGGGDVRPEHVRRIIEDALGRASSGPPVFLEAGL